MSYDPGCEIHIHPVVSKNYLTLLVLGKTVGRSERFRRTVPPIAA
jgi:hypothetical protein